MGFCLACWRRLNESSKDWWQKSCGRRFCVNWFWIQKSKNDDYVLSVIDGCANLKKFEKDTKTGAIRLLSESKNPKHKPIYVSSEDDFMINGRIISVVKK